MVTFFPGVLVGFQWHAWGLTLMQVVMATLAACALLIFYALSAAHLGARSGQTYSVLARTVFGRWGARLISVNLVWMFIVWYGLTALFSADAIIGIYRLDISAAWLAALIAVAMAFNNFFGFSGVANFARWLAAPVLLLWVGYSFCLGASQCGQEVLFQAPERSFWSALTLVSAFTIGTATWGNEPDYWRYGQPRVAYSAVPIVIALLIGQVIFPTTGWLLSHISGISSYAEATAFMNSYSFGGLPLLAAAVLTISYFAINDSNLYGSTNAVENLYKTPHRRTVLLLAVAGAFTAACLSLTGTAYALEKIAALNCIVMCTPTVILIAEWLLGTRILRARAYFQHIPDFSELPAIRYPALLALVCGLGVGLFTSGVLPATEAWHVGVAPLQAWLTSIAVYVPLRIMEWRNEKKQPELPGVLEPASRSQPLKTAAGR